MTAPNDDNSHVEVVTMQYTTLMIYGPDGEFVAEERQHDDHSYDSTTRPLTDEERGDYL